MAVIVVPKYEYVPETLRELQTALLAGKRLSAIAEEANRRNLHWMDLAASAKAVGDMENAVKHIEEACQSSFFLHMLNYLQATEQTHNFLDYVCSRVKDKTA